MPCAAITAPPQCRSPRASSAPGGATPHPLYTAPGVMGRGPMENKLDQATIDKFRAQKRELDAIRADNAKRASEAEEREHVLWGVAGALWACSQDYAQLERLEMNKSDTIPFAASYIADRLRALISPDQIVALGLPREGHGNHRLMRHFAAGVADVWKEIQAAVKAEEA